MSSLSPSDVRHIAKLSRLELNEEEVARYAKQLTGILDYVGQVQEIGGALTEAVSQVTGQSNAFRSDIPAEPGATPEALLACSPRPVVERQVQTHSAH